MSTLRFGFLVITLSAFLVACAGSDGGGLRGVARPHRENVTVEAPTVLAANHSALGPILTDYNGRTLYIYLGDLPDSGRSAVTGDLINKWPVFTTESNLFSPEIGGVLNTFTIQDVEIRRLLEDEAAQGNAGINFSYTTKALQVTYNGWPLYYFIGDEGPGDILGQNVDNFMIAVP